MTLQTWERPVLAGFTVAFVVLGLVWPSLRLWRRTGFSGFVANRPPTPVHAVAVSAFRLAVLGFLAWVIAVCTLGLERIGGWRPPAELTLVGWTLGALGLVVVLVAQAQMGRSWRIGIDAQRRTELVAHGLFRVVRNPIFSGMAVVLLGVVLATPSPWSIALWLFTAHALALQVRLEEAHLLEQHGDAYLRFASNAGRFVPFLGRLAPSPDPTSAR